MQVVAVSPETQSAPRAPAREPYELAGWRRANEPGPAWRPESLERTRWGQHCHRGRHWSELDLAMRQELERQCWGLHDVTRRRAGIELPAWANMHGSEGKALVPRRLRSLFGLVYTCQVRGRAFALMLSNAELAAILGVSRRTVQYWVRDMVALGLVEGEGGDGRVKTRSGILENQAPRTWRPGDGERPSDQDRNLLRLGPVALAAMGDGWAERRRRDGARLGVKRHAARRDDWTARKAARDATYERAAEIRERHRGEAAASEDAKTDAPEPTPLPSPPPPTDPAPSSTDPAPVTEEPASAPRKVAATEGTRIGVQISHPTPAPPWGDRRAEREGSAPPNPPEENESRDVRPSGDRATPPPNAPRSPLAGPGFRAPHTSARRAPPPTGGAGGPPGAVTSRGLGTATGQGPPTRGEARAFLRLPDQPGAGGVGARTPGVKKHANGAEPPNPGVQKTARRAVSTDPRSPADRRRDAAPRFDDDPKLARLIERARRGLFGGH